MPAYEYQALDAGGSKCKGILEADSERQARQQLRERELIPVEVSPTRKKEKGAARARFWQRISIAELSLFTRHLATLIQSGIPVEEALHATAKQTRKPRLQAVVMSLRSRVLEGHTLADGLAEFPGVFNPVYCALVRSGEKSGDLAEVLNQLAEYTEESQKLRGTVLQALIYPLVLTVVAIGVIGVLMAYVVPKVVAQFDHYGQALPLLTRVLIVISDATVAYWPYLFLLLAALFGGARWWLHDETRRRRWHRFSLRLPVLGALLQELDSARMLRTLGILVASGVSLVEAIQVARDTLSNLHLQSGMDQVSKDVREGKSFSFSLQQVGQLPPMAVYMISSGEQSGELEAMIKRAASNLERELASRVQIFTSLFEPLLIIVLGLVVLAIVLAILLPILQLNNLTQF